MALDFDSIPDPTIIEELDFEAILEASLVNLQARAPGYSELVESDPGVKILEVSCYREVLQRARVNDALRGTLVRYAIGADLDNIASNYQVQRLAGETDEQLRVRTVERIRGSSAAGSESWYRYHALTADVDIAEVGIDNPAPGTVRVSVLSQLGDGTPSAQMLENVDLALQDSAVRVVTDTVIVQAATIVTVPITATVYLLPDTPLGVFDGLEATLAAAFDAEARLGWDVTQSWIIGQLQAQGVQRVELDAPTADVAVSAITAPALGTVTLTFGGRDL